MSEIIDLGKAARAAARVRRARCAHHYEKRKNGTERCAKCGDEFPCRGLACTHIDCITRGIKTGVLAGFPKNFPYPLRVIAGDHTFGEDCKACVLDMDGHYYIFVDPAEKPSSWILPEGWRLV